MVKHFVLWILFLTSPLVFSQTNVKIGNQVWMAKNLDVDKFRNGDVIPESKDKESWQKASDNEKPAWCYYEFDKLNGKKYGKLYNWHAVNDPRILAPNGFHVPSVEEWTTLMNNLGGEQRAGDKMKDMTEWWGNRSNENDSSGFNALPGGYCYSDGTFNDIVAFGYWWSSTEENEHDALAISLFCNESKVYINKDDKFYGFSVRCIKD